jgi:hypothetical protein
MDSLRLRIKEFRCLKEHSSPQNILVINLQYLGTKLFPVQLFRVAVRQSCWFLSPRQEHWEGNEPSEIDLNMNDLENFFAVLSKHERKPALNLISQWNPSDVKSITTAFQVACDNSRIQFEVESSISAPSLGNKVADQFVKGVSKTLPRYSLCECPGNGYPDQLLRRLKDGCPFAFELKAKTSFDRNDGNRLVLTSASQKLRRHFSPGRPICHVLATVFFEKSRLGKQCRIWIVGLRLDFLRPLSPVQVRYEASVSQRLLSRGTHANRLLIPAWVRNDSRHYGAASMSA